MNMVIRYRSCANLYEYVADSGLVPRIPRLSPEEFKLRFDTPRTPVIMPDIVPKVTFLLIYVFCLNFCSGERTVSGIRIASFSVSLK